MRGNTWTLMNQSQPIMIGNSDINNSRKRQLFWSLQLYIYLFPWRGMNICSARCWSHNKGSIKNRIIRPLGEKSMFIGGGSQHKGPVMREVFLSMWIYIYISYICIYIAVITYISLSGQHMSILKSLNIYHGFHPNKSTCVQYQIVNIFSDPRTWIF